MNIVKGTVKKIFYGKNDYYIFTLDDTKIKGKIKDTISIGDKLEVKGEIKTDNMGSYLDIESYQLIKEERLLAILIHGIGAKIEERFEEVLGSEYMNALKKDASLAYDCLAPEKTKDMYEQLKTLPDDYFSFGDEFYKTLSKQIKGLGYSTAKEYIVFVQRSGKEPAKLKDKLVFYSFFGSNNLNAMYSDIYFLDSLIQEFDTISEWYNPYIAKKLFEVHKDVTMSVLADNPYEAVKYGFDFLDADDIALSRFQLDTKSMQRIVRAAEYLLIKREEEGSTFEIIDQLLYEMKELLKIDDIDYMRDILMMVAKYDEPEFIIKDERIFRRVIFFTERKISLMLKGMFQDKQIFVPREIFMGIVKSNLNKEQKDAVIGAIRNRVSIITGGPGTGKTTTMNELCNSLEKMGKVVALCAPTGRAAKRISETTGRPAYTIHKLLEYSKRGIIGTFLKNENNPIQCDYLICDEASMIDVYLVNSLLKALKKGSSLILVGDVDQLPSVSMGNILKDLKESGKIPVFELKTIYRQGNDSYIIKNAANVNSNKPLDLKQGSDFSFNQINGTLDLSVIDKDSQILCDMKVGSIGTNVINKAMQDRFNANGKEIIAYGRRYREGDKVIQTKNNWDKDIANGEIGYIESVNGDEVTIDFPNNIPQLITYSKKELKDIDLAYAITIHKSQGSEFPKVLMCLSDNKDFVDKSIVYTGITRAKQHFEMYSCMSKDEIASLKSSNARATNLCDLLKEMN